MSFSGSSRSSAKTDLSEQDIEFIMANTDFSKEKIIEWHAEFIKVCPQNKLDKEKFIQFYSKLIPGDNSSERSYCEAVFQACDTDSNGFIDFAEFLLAFCVSAKGNLREKLAWLFEIYDTDRSSYISLYELAKMLKLVLSIKNINEDAYQRARKIFELMDRSNDNRISKQEFIAGCTKDQETRELFAPF